MGSRTVKIGAEDGNKVMSGMPSFVPAVPNSNSLGTEGNNIRSSRISEFGTLEQSLGFRIEDAVDLNPVYNQMKSSSQALGTDIRFSSLNKTLQLQNEPHANLVSTSGGHRENWGESTMAEASPRTDTSTDDTDDKNERLERGLSAALAVSDSSDKSKEKSGDQKTLRRLAQNREAARKSRLRKKAYVQQLESSRLKLTQLEQELQRARQQGIFISSSGDQSHSMSGNDIPSNFGMRICPLILNKHWLFFCFRFGRGAIKGFEVGRGGSNGVCISHLLFADDTLIFCEDVENQVRNLRCLLLCFKAVFGLRINLVKSEVIPIGKVGDVQGLADILGCRVSSIPMTYLGLPLGAKFKCVSIWDGIVERFERRLAGWKRIYLSKGLWLMGWRSFKGTFCGGAVVMSIGFTL